MTLARLVALVLVIAVVLVARPASAQLPPRAFRLEVTRAGDCPDVDGVRDAIAVAAHVDPVEPDARARLVVTLTQAGAIARGRWQMVGADGRVMRERTVTITGTCRQLVSELALTFVVFYETPPAEEAPPCPPPECDLECRARVRDEVRDELREEVRRSLLAAGYRPRMGDVGVAIMAGGLLSLGYTADPGGGVWLGGELHGDVLHGAIEARVLFPSRVVQEPTKQPFELTSVTFAFVPCARWKLLMGCAFVDVGMLIAGGSVTPVSGDPVIATIGVGPRVALHVPIGDHFGVRAFADLRFAPAPSSFNFVDTGARWESNVASGLFGIGATFE